MTTDKPTPEMPDVIYVERDKSEFYYNIDAADDANEIRKNCVKYTRPSELRQAGVDGIDLTEWHDFASKISDMLWGGELGWTRTGLGGMLAVLKERIEQADDFKRETLASIIHSEDNYQEQLTALQPAAQKTEGAGEVYRKWKIAVEACNSPKSDTPEKWEEIEKGVMHILVVHGEEILAIIAASNKQGA